MTSGRQDQLPDKTNRGSTRAIVGKRSLTRRVSSATLMIVLAIIVAFPVIWMVSSSLKSTGEVLAYPPSLVPEEFQFSNYADVFRYNPFASQYRNSLYISAINVTVTVLICTFAGYAFARIKFFGRTFIFVFLLAALFMPTEVLLIPLYLQFRDFGWLGTHLPLIAEPIFGVPGILGTFLMRQAFLSTPPELEDAARVDGLGRAGFLWKIGIPLVRPALAAVVILTFIHSWNAYLEPLVYVGGPPEALTIPVGLTQYVDDFNFPIWQLQMAAAALSMLPILIVFIIAQRQFVQGFARSGIQG